MTSNQIKAIACLCMLIDHIGFLFFPEVEFLRWIGRLAVPLFAYFIGEGCYYTSNPKRYFGRLFGLAVVCQLFYMGAQFARGDLSEVYLNILFTFSLSLPLCFSYLQMRKSRRNGYPNIVLEKTAIFFVTVFVLAVFCLFCTKTKEEIGIAITLDYGIAGVFLPLFAVLHRSTRRKRITYAIGVILFALILFFETPYSWFSLLSIPILCFHNGEQGNKKWQYAFYLFYPLHFAALYGIDLLIK